MTVPGRRHALKELSAGAVSSFLTGSARATEVPVSLTFRLSDFGGGTKENVANDEALEALLRAATSSTITEDVNDRVPGIRILLERGPHRFARPIMLENVTVQFVGEESVLVFDPVVGNADAFIELGNSHWLSELDKGYRRVDFDGVTIDARRGNASYAIRNRGMRSVGIRRCHILGGRTGFQSEGAFAALDLETVFFQGQSNVGVHLLRRNNLATLYRVSVLGGGRVKIGFLFESAGAEMGAVQLSMTDAEGCEIGYRIAGDNIGNILFLNAWAELCQVSIDVVNAPRTNTYGVQVIGGQFDGTVRFGSPETDGLLRGCGIGGGAKMSNGMLEIGVPTGVSIGDVIWSGVSRIIYGHRPDQPPQRLGPFGLAPSAERQARYDAGHEVPQTSGDRRGMTGDIRWDDQRIYVQTQKGWRSFAGTRFENGTLPELPRTSVPDVSGLTCCIANGGDAVSRLAGGHAGQRITIVGSNAGRIIKAGAARLPGNRDVALGDGDVLELLGLGQGQWVCAHLQTDNYQASCS